MYYIISWYCLVMTWYHGYQGNVVLGSLVFCSLSVGLFEYMPVVTQRVVANAKPSSSNASYMYMLQSAVQAAADQHRQQTQSTVSQHSNMPGITIVVTSGSSPAPGPGRPGDRD
eukprot:scpid25768/ scgid3597/ 